MKDTGITGSVSSVVEIQLSHTQWGILEAGLDLHYITSTPCHINDSRSSTFLIYETELEVQNPRLVKNALPHFDKQTLM